MEYIVNFGINCKVFNTKTIFIILNFLYKNFYKNEKGTRKNSAK
jgi:hypothetical protein